MSRYDVLLFSKTPSMEFVSSGCLKNLDSQLAMKKNWQPLGIQPTTSWSWYIQTNRWTNIIDYQSNTLLKKLWMTKFWRKIGRSSTFKLGGHFVSNQSLNQWCVQCLKKVLLLWSKNQNQEKKKDLCSTNASSLIVFGRSRLVTMREKHCLHWWKQSVAVDLATPISLQVLSRWTFSQIS